MRRTWFRGNGGYLYADLLVALMILSLLATSLFASARHLKSLYAKERDLATETVQIYQESMLGEQE